MAKKRYETWGRLRGWSKVLRDSTYMMRVCRVLLWLALVGAMILPLAPAELCRADTPTSLSLTGWGWCLAYKDVGNVTANLTGTLIPRAEAPEISDIYLSGTLRFNLGERTDSFDLELRGTKVRSLFFLRQSSGGGNPLIAEFEGTWLEETDYVACQGRLAVPLPDHVARPYVFVLRTPDRAIVTGEPGNFVENIEYSIRKGASAFNTMADRLGETGDHIKELVGTVLTQIGVMLREVRSLGTPYFP